MTKICGGEGTLLMFATFSDEIAFRRILGGWLRIQAHEPPRIPDENGLLLRVWIMQFVIAWGLCHIYIQMEYTTMQPLWCPSQDRFRVWIFTRDFSHWWKIAMSAHLNVQSTGWAECFVQFFLSLLPWDSHWATSVATFIRLEILDYYY